MQFTVKPAHFLSDRTFKRLLRHKNVCHPASVAIKSVIREKRMVSRAMRSQEQSVVISFLKLK